MGAVRFGAPTADICWLRDQFHLTAFVETGTNYAASAVWASGEFERVVTIEGFEPLYDKATQQHGHLSNVQFVFGDSRTCLRQVLTTLASPALVWLDAHWCGPDTYGIEQQCPLLGELQALNECPIDHFVLIDDARLFLAPPPKPHPAPDWPGLLEVCELLTRHPSPRFVAVHDDVIFVVPEYAKGPLITYLQEVATAQLLPANPGVVRPLRTRRTLRASLSRLFKPST